jgi:PilZ domain
MVAAFSYVQDDKDEHRQFQRVPVAVAGRYMLQDRQDYACQTTDISPGDLFITCPIKGAVGERVIAYLDHLGRIEGKILRHTPTGVAMSISASSRKRDKLAAQLTWLTNRKSLGLPEDRRHERVAPKNPRSILILDDGIERVVRLIDVSLSGAAIATDIRAQMNSIVTIGQVKGRVVRYIEGGIAVEFLFSLAEETLHEQVSA